MDKTGVGVVGSNLVITVDLESIRFQIENHPIGFRIRDYGEFVNYLQHIDATSYCPDEGNYGLDRLFDELLIQAYENNELFIERKEESSY